MSVNVAGGQSFVNIGHPILTQSISPLPLSDYPSARRDHTAVTE
jgi:hypothetical protein